MDCRIESLFVHVLKYLLTLIIDWKLKGAIIYSVNRGESLAFLSWPRLRVCMLIGMIVE